MSDGWLFLLAFVLLMGVILNGLFAGLSLIGAYGLRPKQGYTSLIVFGTFTGLLPMILMALFVLAIYQKRWKVVFTQIATWIVYLLLSIVGLFYMAFRDLPIPDQQLMMNDWWSFGQAILWIWIFVGTVVGFDLLRRMRKTDDFELRRTYVNWIVVCFLGHYLYALVPLL